MILQVFITLLLLLGFSLIILFVEFLHRNYTIDPEYTRKIAHTLASLSSLVFLIRIPVWSVLIIALFFSLLLFFGKRNGLFNSIDSVPRKTGGSYLLPVSILMVYWFSRKTDNDIYFLLPVLIMGISDPLAGLTGLYYRNRIKRMIFFGYQLRKTLVGSAAFFISALCLNLICLSLYRHDFVKAAGISLLIAASGAITEFISPNGSDNLTVPAVTAAMLYLTI